MRGDEDKEHHNKRKRFEMKIHLALMMGVVMSGSVLLAYAEDSTAAAAEELKAAKAPCVYVCPDCHSCAMKAGKCSGCAKDMMKSHVLAIQNGMAMVCACGDGCKCDAKGMKDGKCACGKDVGKVSLKGMYICPEGCPVVSAMAGKCCGCGKDMKAVE